MGLMGPARSRLRVRRNDKPVADAAVARLVRAVETLFARETVIGPCAYRQDPLIRVLVKEQAERVAEMLGIGGQE